MPVSSNNNNIVTNNMMMGNNIVLPFEINLMMGNEGKVVNNPIDDHFEDIIEYTLDRSMTSCIE